MDVETRLIVGCFVGARDEAGARGLWQALPAVYRQCAVCYRDCWRADRTVVPSQRPKPGGTARGKTSYIARFNNTVRQRGSRFVRQTLSFSKNLENHIGAIWYFIHDYNQRQLQRLTTTFA